MNPNWEDGATASSWGGSGGWGNEAVNDENSNN